MLLADVICDLIGYALKGLAGCHELLVGPNARKRERFVLCDLQVLIFHCTGPR